MSNPRRRFRWVPGVAAFGRITAALALPVLMAACTGQGGEVEATPEAGMSMKLSSHAFDPKAPIPVRHTCDGEDVPPPLRWSDVPQAAKSLVLIVDDPDAPDPAAPERTWVHWVLYNLPPSASGLAEGVEPAQLPEGTREGINDWKRTGYGGPCPPIGRHRYFHKLYALDTVLPDLGRPDKTRLLEKMEGHMIAHAELVGTYQRD